MIRAIVQISGGHSNIGTVPSLYLVLYEGCLMVSPDELNYKPEHLALIKAGINRSECDGQIKIALAKGLTGAKKAYLFHLQIISDIHYGRLSCVTPDDDNSEENQNPLTVAITRADAERWTPMYEYEEDMPNEVDIDISSKSPKSNDPSLRTACLIIRALLNDVYKKYPGRGAQEGAWIEIEKAFNSDDFKSLRTPKKSTVKKILKEGEDRYDELIKSE